MYPKEEWEKEEQIDGEPYRGARWIFISQYRALPPWEGKEGAGGGEGGAEERVDAPLIDLHKIAVSWLRLPALRADKKASDREADGGRGEQRRAVCRYESRYAV